MKRIAGMIFTLEALQAKKGDALVLHYGSADKPHFIVIDAGPEGVYKNSMRPRLAQLHARWKRESDDQLPIELAMVSHIDDDHINGILDWIKEIEKNRAVPCSIRTFWYNSFDEILGNEAEEIRARVASLAKKPPTGSGELRNFGQAVAVVASVAQGRELRQRIDKLNIDLNSGGGLIMLDESDTSALSAPGGLALHVAGPIRSRVEALRKDWDKHVTAHPGPVALAAFVDRSIPNLSSIVVVAEFENRRMLLTGDARGDDIVAGLKALNMLDGNGGAHFDLIKMPHHGSNRNMTFEWLQNIKADHYVISANGEHENPDAETVEWICKAREGQTYTIYFTNETMVDPKTGLDVGQAVQKALTDHPNPGRKVVFRKPSDLSVKAELGEAVTY
jgi:hypothetical protein